MMKIMLLLLSLSGCSTAELSSTEESRGRYLFNTKLKTTYTNFLNQTVFKNGSTLYAGPALVQFNNRQVIYLEGIAPSEVMSTVHVAKDGSQLEYLSHNLIKVDSGKYFIPFTVYFKSLAQLEKVTFKLTLDLKCKESSDCSYHHATDMIRNKDPYDFHFTFSDADYFTTEIIDLSQFSISESSAILNRFIFPGMGQKAAEASIGRNTNHFIHGYYNVKFENGFVQNFEFRFRQDLPVFNRN